jgi:hypothetical protein
LHKFWRVGWIVVLRGDLRRVDTRELLSTIDSDLQRRGVKMRGGRKMSRGGKKREEEMRIGDVMRSGAERRSCHTVRRSAIAAKNVGRRKIAVVLRPCASWKKWQGSEL